MSKRRVQGRLKPLTHKQRLKKDERNERRGRDDKIVARKERDAKVKRKRKRKVL